MKTYLSAQIIFATLLFASVSYAVPVVISRGKPVTANDYYGTQYPSLVTDGNYLSSWYPTGYSGWAEIDLQESTVLSQLTY